MEEDMINALSNTPIGLFYKCACYINANLSNNIGKFDGTYDGFATPVGGRPDIYYNTDHVTPFFKQSLYKNEFDNYIDYVEHVYFLSSIDKLFNGRMEPMTPERIKLHKVGVVDGYDILRGYSADVVLDSLTGQLNNVYLSSTLVSSAYHNSERNENYTKSISSSLIDYFGLTEQSAANITQRFNFNQQGRIYTDLGLYGSPVGNTSFYGDPMYADKEQAWIESLNADSLRFIGRALNNLMAADSQFGEGVDNSAQLFQNINRAIYNRSYFHKLLEGQFSNPNPMPDSYSEETAGRYIINGTRNETHDTGDTLYEYAEYEAGASTQVQGNFNGGIKLGRYDTNIVKDANVNDLIQKTNTAFRDNKYRTLISRFHSSAEDEKGGKEIQTAYSTQYGLSHGRNLLKVDPTTDNYDNPYCRVWTYHFQYRNLISAIRPFVDGGDYESAKIVTQGDLSDTYDWKYMANQFGEAFDDVTDGRSRLGLYSVLNPNNGLVNIAPTSKAKDGEDKAIDVRHCMFSIENLAWKGYREGEYGLSPEQMGPMGGRIMWFPPYDLEFNESVNVNWNENSFIGRGEKIYTYIDTVRAGNIHFKVLVDHPSIIDYYKRRDEDWGGNGGVDDTGSPEQQLLRFFAGCDILTAAPNQIDSGNINNELDLPPLPKQEIPDVPEQKEIVDAQLIFYVFYPNNYSGVDDPPGKGPVSAMEYLANGLCTQMAITDGGDEVVDFAVQKVQYTYGSTDSASTDLGGYEITNGGLGVSVVTTETLRNSNQPIINGTRKGRDLGETINGIKLATQYVKPNKFKGTSEWYYRVDRAYEGQKLIPGNYVDGQSFGLNTSNGLKFIQENLETSSESVIGKNFFSFIDVYCALDDEMHSLMSKTGRGIANEDHINTIKEMLSTFTVKEISGQGMASSHGYASSNNVLNQNRYNSVAKWLQTYSIMKNAENVHYRQDDSIGDVSSGAKKTNSVTNEFAKLYRSARVVIHLETEKTITLQDEQITDTANGSTVMGASGITYELSGVGQINVPKSVMDSVMQQYPNDKQKQEQLLKQMLVENPYQFFNNRTPEFEEKLKQWQKQAKQEVQKKASADAKIESMKRYDNEANFFRSIQINDDFLHHMIKDKIKYFDPAFHSISPEGFNARLTFLQQCTRQGSTYSANEGGMNIGNATNLSFGTPPVCVLRVGDFYNTKVIFTNMQIKYEMWDLNPEGIGVQPMVAEIDMSFYFLGGQDMSNPIPRLQNALSFNYYKNTSVYDNRSEMIQYDKENNGEIVKFRGVKH